MKKLLFVVIIVVVAAVLVSPWLVGMRAETLFRQNVDALSARLDRPVTVVHYVRGWFHSTAITTTDLDKDTTLTFRHRITHGPWLTFGWTRIKSIPKTADNPKLSYYFGDAPPVTLTTRIGFDGSIHVHGQSPAFERAIKDHPGTRLAWGGLDTHIDIDGRHATFVVELPRLSAKGPDGELSLTGIHADGSGQTALPGQTDAPNAWASDMRVHVERLFTINPKADRSLTLKADWQAETALNDADQLGMQSTLKLTDLTAQPLSGDDDNPFSLTDMRLKIRLDGVDPQPLLRYVDDMHARAQRLQKRYGTLQGEAGRQLERYGRQRLAGLLPLVITPDTQLHVGIPTFDSNRGTLGLTTDADFVDSDGPRLQLPAVVQLIRTLRVQLHVFFDDSLVSYMTPEHRNTLDEMVRKHWLQHDDDRYTLKARLQGLKLKVNGHDAPILGRVLTQLLLAGQ